MGTKDPEIKEHDKVIMKAEILVRLRHASCSPHIGFQAKGGRSALATKESFFRLWHQQDLPQRNEKSKNNLSPEETATQAHHASSLSPKTCDAQNETKRIRC